MAVINGVCRSRQPRNHDTIGNQRLTEKNWKSLYEDPLSVKPKTIKHTLHTELNNRRKEQTTSGSVVKFLCSAERHWSSERGKWGSIQRVRSG